MNYYDYYNNGIFNKPQKAESEGEYEVLLNGNEEDDSDNGYYHFYNYLTYLIS